MGFVPAELKAVAEQVEKGQAPSVNVRTLLGWFDAQRRGFWVVRMIRQAFEELELITAPDFEAAYIDSPVRFLKKVRGAREADMQAEPTPAPAEPGVSLQQSSDSTIAIRRAYADQFYRIGRLASANNPPLAIAPTSRISEAITLMLMHDFSQLPVMNSDRDVKGLVTWKSIGSKMALSGICNLVHECMEPHQEVPYDSSLFNAISLVARYDCVLVRDHTRKICGIVTASDLALQFGQLGEPFLFLGEIENRIRRFLDTTFNAEELRAARNPEDAARQVRDAGDLTFGEYLRLLERPEKWEKLKLAIDRGIFVKDLEEIRRIRNDVMHFDPDGIGEDDLSKLRKFAVFLEKLQTTMRA